MNKNAAKLTSRHCDQQRGQWFMKRQKRNRDERAYSRGYLAGYHGRPSDYCPFGALQARTNWLSGWREGRDNHVQGMVGIAGIQHLKDVT